MKIYNFYYMKWLILILFGFANSLNLESQCKFTSITSGLAHSVAIAENGTLWAWGRNHFGQLGTGDFQDADLPKLVSLDSNWTMVSARGDFSLALKSDGTIWACGNNDNGQLGNGNTISKGSFTKVESLIKFKFISASEFNSLAISNGGAIYSWGYVPRIFTNLTSDAVYTPLKLNFSEDWQQVHQNPGQQTMFHFLGLKTNGSLWSWGGNGSFKLGLGIQKDTFFTQPVRINAANNFIKILNGETFCFALDRDGSLWSWGTNANGELGNNEYYESSYNPKIVGIPNEWSDCAVSTRTMTSAGVKKDGSLWIWGDGGYFQFNDPEKKRSNTPERIGIKNDWKNCYLGWQVNFASDNLNYLYSWGVSSWGKMGLGPLREVKTPTSICCSAISNKFDTSICIGDTVVVNGKSFYLGVNISIDTLKSYRLCDSVVFTEIQYFPSDTTVYRDSLCFNDKIVIDGIQFSRFNPVGVLERKQNGKFKCDSLVFVDIFFADSLYVHDVISKDSINYEIIVTPIGGIPPYKFLWSTGDTSSSIFVNGAGNFHLEVIDQLGCRVEKSYLIIADNKNRELSISYSYFILDNSLILSSDINIEKVWIYDIFGKEYFTSNFNTEIASIDLGQFYNSIRICRFKTKDNQFYSFKFYY